jgi:hypothetical protein
MLLVGVAVAASSQPNNLRGGIMSEDSGYDLFDISTIDFFNLPCHMLTDQRDNSQCINQGKDCAAEGKLCYIVTTATRQFPGCGDPNTCDNPNERSSSQTTTTSTTTPACLPANATGCFPAPNIPPNCCPGSECRGDPGSVTNSSYMVFKCFGWGDLMDGGQLVE